MGVCCSSRDGHGRVKPVVRALSTKSQEALTRLDFQAKKLNTLVQNVIDSGEPWVDEDFPP